MQTSVCIRLTTKDHELTPDQIGIASLLPGWVTAGPCQYVTSCQGQLSLAYIWGR